MNRGSCSRTYSDLFTFKILFVVEANIEHNEIYPISMDCPPFNFKIPLKEGRYGAEEMFIVVV